MPRKNFSLLVFVSIVCACSTLTHAADLLNGSFETGDFSNWIATDKLNPFDQLRVGVLNDVTSFIGFTPDGASFVIPSDGDFAATHGFDGGTGPGVVSLAQDIGVIGSGEMLLFDYRAGWDLFTFCTGCSDRTFDVSIEPAGGGAALATFNVLTAVAGTTTFFNSPNNDTGALEGMVDLTPFAGTDARVNFRWTMPDAFSGPANGQLDNVRIVPEPSSSALLVFSFCLLTGIARSGKYARS